MHINLNNPGDHFLQLSPLISRGEHPAPSPLLSPDPLFYAPPPSQDMMSFRLEQNQEQQLQDFMGPSIDNLSPPMPYFSNIQRLDESDRDSEREQQKVEELQPNSRRKKQPKSSRSIEIKTQNLPPIKLPDSQLPPIRAIIEFLVENSAQPEKELLQNGRSLWAEGQDFQQVLASLVGKFKKLRKTKQEMTKYCMRKVFKFIADRMRKDRTHNRDVDTCMKIYFSKGQTGNNFSIPFKKNSVQKTMNGNFLKRVFTSQNFLKDYRDFIRDFHELMAEDNEKKVIYLADVLDKHIRLNELKKIESIKRLPWTREILQQTEQLAVSLLAYADERMEEMRDQ